jgi:hypothetical protein
MTSFHEGMIYLFMFVQGQSELGGVGRYFCSLFVIVVDFLNKINGQIYSLLFFLLSSLIFWILFDRWSYSKYLFKYIIL